MQASLRRSRPACTRRGFTLIEMMVAILLIGVGLMGLAAMSSTVSRANVQSSSLTTASALAQERLERFRTEPYVSIVSGVDSRVVDCVTYTRAWTVGGGLEYGFTPNWSAKAEYMYASFANETYLSAVVPGGTEFGADIHTVKFGINYRFGGFGGPIMARY